MRIKCSFSTVTYGVKVRILTKRLVGSRRAVEDQALTTNAFDQRSKCQRCPRYDGRVYENQDQVHDDNAVTVGFGPIGCRVSQPSVWGRQLPDASRFILFHRA